MVCEQVEWLRGRLVGSCSVRVGGLGGRRRPGRSGRKTGSVQDRDKVFCVSSAREENTAFSVCRGFAVALAKVVDSRAGPRKGRLP